MITRQEVDKITKIMVHLSRCNDDNDDALRKWLSHRLRGMSKSDLEMVHYAYVRRMKEMVSPERWIGTSEWGYNDDGCKFYFTKIRAPQTKRNPSRKRTPTKIKQKTFGSQWQIAQELPRMPKKSLIELDKMIAEHNSAFLKREKIARKEMKEQQLKTDHSKRRLWKLEL